MLGATTLLLVAQSTAPPLVSRPPDVLRDATPPCWPEPLAAPTAIVPYSAAPAHEWTDLFGGSSGWTGADGVYSIPLSADERPCAGHLGATFFTFGDTFIGEVDDQGQRLPGSVLVNNTQARLVGGTPETQAIQFFWGDDGGGQPFAQLVPDTSPADFFWPLDGVVEDGVLYLFALRMTSTGGPFGVGIGGVSQLAWTVGGGQPFATYTQVDTPLAFGLDSFGRALLSNTHEAGAPEPDGFIYVYGLREAPLNKQLLVGRVPAGQIGDFENYRVWDGSGWNPNAATAAPLVDRLSAEFSVSPLADGRFLLCYQQDDFLGPDVTVRIGASPIGPFGPATPIWRIPEPAQGANWFAYGAKAHPHLSRPDRLLISYHVNTFDFAEHFADASIYRPRFVELPLASR